MNIFDLYCIHVLHSILTWHSVIKIQAPTNWCCLPFTQTVGRLSLSTKVACAKEFFTRKYGIQWETIQVVLQTRPFTQKDGRKGLVKQFSLTRSAKLKQWTLESATKIARQMAVRHQLGMAMHTLDPTL